MDFAPMPVQSSRYPKREHQKLFGFLPRDDWPWVDQKGDERIPTTCRLERAYREALEGRANDLKVTLSDLMHRYVTAGLREDATKVVLHEELPVIREEIKQLRRDLSLLAEVLLSRAGKLDPAKAREWAMQNFAAR